MEVIPIEASTGATGAGRFSRVHAASPSIRAAGTAGKASSWSRAAKLDSWWDTNSNWACDPWCGSERGRDQRDDSAHQRFNSSIIGTPSSSPSAAKTVAPASRRAALHALRSVSAATPPMSTRRHEPSRASDFKPMPLVAAHERMRTSDFRPMSLGAAHEGPDGFVPSQFRHPRQGHIGEYRNVRFGTVRRGVDTVHGADAPLAGARHHGYSQYAHETAASWNDDGVGGIDHFDGGNRALLLAQMSKLQRRQIDANGDGQLSLSELQAHNFSV